MFRGRQAGMDSIGSLEEYMKAGNQVTVAVNGATGSRGFLAASPVWRNGRSQMKLVAYGSAAEAAQAKGETNFCRVPSVPDSGNLQQKGRFHRLRL